MYGGLDCGFGGVYFGKIESQNPDVDHWRCPTWVGDGGGKALLDPALKRVRWISGCRNVKAHAIVRPMPLDPTVMNAVFGHARCRLLQGHSGRGSFDQCTSPFPSFATAVVRPLAL